MIRKIAALAAAWLVAFPAHATDALALEVGYGEDRTSLLRFAIVDRWDREPRALGRKWQLTGYWDFSAALWDNAVESTADIGITPVFRVERGALYLEAAIGLHLVQTHISASRVFSTAVQFGDHVGIGWRSGRWEYAARLQHLSNAGLDHPNPGINFVLFRVQYELR
jgi:hypothetical protein